MTGKEKMKYDRGGKDKREKKDDCIACAKDDRMFFYIAVIRNKDISALYV